VLRGVEKALPLPVPQLTRDLETHGVTRTRVTPYLGMPGFGPQLGPDLNLTEPDPWSGSVRGPVQCLSGFSDRVRSGVHLALGLS
jgi:hypothetical protein